MQAVRVKALGTAAQLVAVGRRHGAAGIGKPPIVRTELIPRLGGLDRIDSLELVGNLARHQKSNFGIARPACGCGLLANDNEGRDIGRYQASHARLQGEQPVFLVSHGSDGLQRAGGNLA